MTFLLCISGCAAFGLASYIALGILSDVNRMRDAALRAGESSVARAMMLIEIALILAALLATGGCVSCFFAAVKVVQTWM
jgi:hypothetical protein